MSASTRRRRYAVARLRLINFHNFVDETLSIAEAGHLFLLGDNASGKTTLLDALHLAFSGGDGLELNAAARVGGRRGEGRSLAGIVLRQDAEHGVRNVGGAVAYCVVELVSQDADRRALCIGLGMEATTMDAAVTRWGVLSPRGLDELPLLEADEQGRPCPLGREELRDRLEHREVFGHLTDYRRAVAEKLFGGASAYEDVCRFWSMAKAYREIVARARDFESLFTRLLPAPELTVFQDILRSLRELSELGVQLEALREQHQYVQALLEARAQIEACREEQARYGWLDAHLALRSERDELSSLEALQRERTQTLAALEAEVAILRSALERADAALREAEAEDDGDLLQKLERARREDEARAAARQETQLRLAALERALDQAKLQFANSRRVWSTQLADWCDRMETAREAVRELPDEQRALEAWLGQVRLLVQRLAQAKVKGEIPQERAPDMPADVEAECAELMARTRRREREAEGALAVARSVLVAAEARLERARARGTVQPEMLARTHALRSLDEAGVEARPLYLEIEPRRDAPALHLAALEALAGDEMLAAIWVAPEQRPRAADVLAREAPDVRLFVHEAGDTTLPKWAKRLLMQASSAVERASHAALAAALSQPRSLGEVEAPDALAAVELRGLGFRLSRELPRYLGKEARARELQNRRMEAEEAFERAELEVIAASQRASLERESVDRARVLEMTTRSILTGRALRQAADATHEARREWASALERVAAAEIADAQAQQVLAEAREIRAALDARAEALSLAELRRRLEALRERKHKAAANLEGAQRRLGGEQTLLTRAEAERQERRAALEQRRVDLEARAETLRALLSDALDDDGLAHYVLVRQRGQQFSGRDNVQARREESARTEARQVEALTGDGSAGVRNMRWAARFGFGWDEAENALRDRRGEPAQSVLAELDRTVREQESVIHEGTRELMERLIMGSLLRHLRAQVNSLDTVVRDINRLLADLRFGSTRYQFRVTPRRDRKEIVDTVRKVSLLDEESRARFRAFVEDRMDELRRADDDGRVPELLDYRRWYDYRLTMRTTGADDVELSRELRQLGSGGEQGVPNYLLVLALAKLMFDSAEARVRPLFFDEAFYGIDAMRRDELLRFATELGLQVVVASPDQDGVTRAVDRSTTIFVLKDELGDVHLARYDYENRLRDVQPSLFDEGPDESPAEEAICVLDGLEDPN